MNKIVISIIKDSNGWWRVGTNGSGTVDAAASRGFATQSGAEQHAREFRGATEIRVLVAKLA